MFLLLAKTIALPYLEDCSNLKLNSNKVYHDKSSHRNIKHDYQEQQELLYRELISEKCCQDNWKMKLRRE